MPLNPTSKVSGELERLRLRIEAAAQRGDAFEVLRIARNDALGARALRWGFGAELNSESRQSFANWCAKTGCEGVLAQLLEAGIPGVGLFECCSYTTFSLGPTVGAYACPYLGAVNHVSPKLFELAQQHLPSERPLARRDAELRMAHHRCLQGLHNLQEGQTLRGESTLTLLRLLAGAGCEPAPLRADGAARALFKQRWSAAAAPYLERGLRLLVTSGQIVPDGSLLDLCVRNGDPLAASAVVRAAEGLPATDQDLFRVANQAGTAAAHEAAAAATHEAMSRAVPDSPSPMRAAGERTPSARRRVV